MHRMTRIRSHEGEGYQLLLGGPDPRLDLEGNKIVLAPTRQATADSLTLIELL